MIRDPFLARAPGAWELYTVLDLLVDLRMISNRAPKDAP
jgi:hypothetical protein